MFREDTLFLLIKNWWKYKPEDELFYRLEENPYYPFKMIADGYFLVVVQSDRAAYGFWFAIVSIIGFIVFTCILGFYAINQAIFLICICLCLWTLKGRIAWRELIISRRGRGAYMLRVQSNQEKLIQHELRNIYIRLTKKDDASGDPYFWLNLSGYELDDYRITRMTKAEYALRVMGMQLACRLGLNFFDWKDESDEHFVFHYKTHSRIHPLIKVPDEQQDVVEKQASISKGPFLAARSSKTDHAGFSGGSEFDSRATLSKAVEGAGTKKNVVFGQ